MTSDLFGDQDHDHLGRGLVRPLPDRSRVALRRTMDDGSQLQLFGFMILITGQDTWITWELLNIQWDILGEKKRTSAESRGNS
jgi:hypothetical protein